MVVQALSDYEAAQEERDCDEFARSAEDDLLDTVTWYASQQVPEVGKRLVAADLERVGQLALFPDTGFIVIAASLPKEFVGTP